MKTLHSTHYWSTRRPDQTKEVIDNGGADNYWCMDPEETIKAMHDVACPWMAYKVLAAGAIHPREGFKHAFANGADFCIVGMFDFQVAEDAAVARAVLKALLDRKRPWRA
jgi:NAD(P)H-dependent flavin oxidoreductase YrpB (nitropropane dioxygenase family)